MILFKKTAYSDGLINLVLKLFGQGPVDFIDGHILGEDAGIMYLYHLDRYAF